MPGIRKVFLSYARIDRDAAREVYEALHLQRGLRLWFDERDLQFGLNWRPAIRKAIRESDFFLALLSKRSSAKRGFRNSELREALEVMQEFPAGRVFLVPARLDKCRPPVLELAELHYLDLFPDRPAGLARLLEMFAPQRSRVSTSSKPALGPRQYYVEVVDLAGGIPGMARICRALTRVQSSFVFFTSVAEAPASSMVRYGGQPQLLLDKLGDGFYRDVNPIEADQILCVTDRYLMFTDGKHLCANYFGRRDVRDERIDFMSVRALDQLSKDAGISLDAAIAYWIVSDVASYFLDLQYHEETRGCPMDFTRRHADAVRGLSRGAFCPECAGRLGARSSLAQAMRRMLRWGR